MISPHTALVFLPFCFAVAIWVSWSDMKFMKIPNKAGLALLILWLVLGLILVPFKLWLWGWALAACVLVAGFILNAGGAVGAGDAKFAASMAPIFIHADIRFVLGLYAACLLGAFAAHRLARLIPPFRAATIDWQSWTHKDFPMGLALSGTLIFYLLAALLPLF
ncbi:prepilin peptidase [Cypionkella sp.]|jgi:prepilin peptidase CpaA|uniref:prepilin peptidase n=1 Tax=Cypionkella sp. TaxID=2811411 RepID=UPI0027214091|nr:prepilin peptidase [Cypionkella sp.]MDO8985764.1 prepilin peptidase [Cypionkella sp.]MDP1575786.1 prepilin peptidase [Cypionkella sp.]MDP2051344.1 prepilin peptidase [Cypionkella sp.]